MNYCTSCKDWKQLLFQLKHFALQWAFMQYLHHCLKVKYSGRCLTLSYISTVHWGEILHGGGLLTRVSPSFSWYLIYHLRINLDQFPFWSLTEVWNCCPFLACLQYNSHPFTMYISSKWNKILRQYHFYFSHTYIILRTCVNKPCPYMNYSFSQYMVMGHLCASYWLHHRFTASTGWLPGEDDIRCTNLSSNYFKTYTVNPHCNGQNCVQLWIFRDVEALRFSS
jgi:hypothetical protein